MFAIVRDCSVYSGLAFKWSASRDAYFFMRVVSHTAQLVAYVTGADRILTVHFRNLDVIIRNGRRKVIINE